MGLASGQKIEWWMALTVGLVAGGAGLAEEARFAPGDLPEATDADGYRYFEVAVSDGTLNLHEDASASSPVITRLAAAVVLSNLGCRTGADHAWCDVQPIEGGARGYAAAEYLRPATGPDGTAPRGYDDSAERAGQGRFDAAGQIPCAQTPSQPMGQCDFGVARAAGGDAAVVIIRPDGGQRVIFFRLGEPVGADTSEADYGAFGASRSGDLSTVTIGGERYEIPDAVVLGG